MQSSMIPADYAVPPIPRNDELERTCQERDLYLRLLNLGTQTEFEPFLEEALSLIVELTGAQQGYLELRDERDDAEAAAWWMGHGCSDEEIDDIRASISRGIIAEALATGETPTWLGSPFRRAATGNH